MANIKFVYKKFKLNVQVLYIGICVMNISGEGGGLQNLRLDFIIYNKRALRQAVILSKYPENA